MNVTPELLVARMIQRRCGAVLGELQAVASCELAPQLDAIAAGRALTTVERDHLAGYLASETVDGGMLSIGQLRDGTDDASARKINRQAKALLALVRTDDA
jgi:hypothetical protein